MLEQLRGWEEIRQALLFVEGFCTFSKHTLAGVEIFQQAEGLTTKVFVKTIDELDSYLGPIFERMHLDMELEFNQISLELDILSEVYGRIVLDYPYDVNKSHVMMP